MTTAEDYATIANQVYGVDPLQREFTAEKRDKFAAPGRSKQQFQVYDTATDPATGFQGMAVVPLIDGLPDHSQVYIAFAGTNPDDRADVVADLVSVVGRRTGEGTQVAEAEKFAERVQARLAADGHSEARIETVGHSLGGYLALYVAAESHWHSTTFNSPDPWGVLSPQAKEWVQAERTSGGSPLTNYVNQFDLVGNFLGHGTGAGVFVEDELWKGVIAHHDLAAAFDFDPFGAMLGLGGKSLTVTELADLVGVANPGHGQALRALDGIVSTVNGVGAVTAGATLSGLLVAVDTVAALGLASSVGSVATELQAIKDVNIGLVPAMTTALTNAKIAALQLYPLVTEADIEECVRAHGLEVEKHIDEEAVAAVNDLLDDHIDTVRKISRGVMNTVTNAFEQGTAWARAYALGSVGGT
ncbi:DUF6792 domain-containing protein [Leifsonia shinshuensis]|uniref:Fungal lipase-like domain-containing protein n=1 Tax=Leifsonia shinshuensis TaxID=150026 RepID=A0A7G6Y5N9_9MICO|nr:DUF6792 domain-containing protein [Leifsonia shinshuensis]QNE33804.1 hypothetical protein F1C12_00685 [Leifsonia shinshuensis]